MEVYIRPLLMMPEHQRLLKMSGVTTSPFYYLTTPIWDTGNSLYPVGSYTIWAECDANSMKDNYDVTGKTISEQTSLLDQDQNPLISVNVPTTSPTTQIATTSPTQTPIIVTTAITPIPTTSPLYSYCHEPLCCSNNSACGYCFRLTHLCGNNLHKIRGIWCSSDLDFPLFSRCCCYS